MSDLMTAIENPRYRADFIAGWKAGMAAHKPGRYACDDSKGAYALTTGRGATWIDGYQGAVSIRNGLYANPPAMAARQIGLAVRCPGCGEWDAVCDRHPCDGTDGHCCIDCCGAHSPRGPERATEGWDWTET